MTLPPPPYSEGPGVMEREEPAREPRKGLFLVRRKKASSYQRQGGVEITTPTYPIPSPSSSTSTVAAPRSSPGGGRRDQLGGYDATCVHPSIDDVWVRCDMTSREEREKHQSVGTGRHRHCRRRRRRNRFQDCSDPAMPNSQLQTFAPSPSPPPPPPKKTPYIQKIVYSSARPEPPSPIPPRHRYVPYALACFCDMTEKKDQPATSINNQQQKKDSLAVFTQIA